MYKLYNRKLKYVCCKSVVFMQMKVWKLFDGCSFNIVIFSKVNIQSQISWLPQTATLLLTDGTISQVTSFFWEPEDLMEIGLSVWENCMLILFWSLVTEIRVLPLSRDVCFSNLMSEKHLTIKFSHSFICYYQYLWLNQIWFVYLFFASKEPK